MFARINTDEYVAPWRPSGSTRESYFRPPAGIIIALERRPWRVIECRELPTSEWTAEERASYHGSYSKHRPPEEFPFRPWVLVVDALPIGGRHQARMPGTTSPRWDVLPEHYPVCVHCLELHPCRHMTTKAEVARGEAKLDKLTSIAPGCCWYCGDRVTSRQKKVLFDGPNLLLPGGHTPVVFHGREGCSAGVWAYEQRVKAAAERA